MKTIAIFFGGESVEHDVSVITGVMTANCLDKTKYNVIPIYLASDGKWYTSPRLFDIEVYKNIDVKKLWQVSFVCGGNMLYRIKGKRHIPIENVAVAINCLHGERGEDGSFSGLLSMCKVASVSPNVLASAISMDKIITKTVMKGLGIKTLPYVKVQGVTDFNIIQKLGYPVMVKPTSLGSSVGIGRANDINELSSAIQNAMRYGDSVICEPLLKDFIEINCAVYKDEKNNVIVSECERPVGASDVLTFNDKYVNGKREFPAKIDKSLSDKIKAITKKVYTELNFNGIIRIDYFIKEREVYLNEINSVPGSLAYYLFSDTMKEFSDILRELIVVAEREFAKSTTYNRKYKSGILNLKGAKGNKRL